MCEDGTAEFAPCITAKEDKHKANGLREMLYGFTELCYQVPRHKSHAGTGTRGIRCEREYADVKVDAIRPVRRARVGEAPRSTGAEPCWAHRKGMLSSTDTWEKDKRKFDIQHGRKQN